MSVMAADLVKRPATINASEALFLRPAVEVALELPFHSVQQKMVQRQVARL